MAIVTAWWSGRAILADTETDGKEPEDARIIQWCAYSIGVDPPDAHESGMVQPERPIPDEAIGVHGITTERAQAEGEPRDEALTRIALALAAAEHDVPVIFHNAAYDLTAIDREMRRLGIGSLEIADDTGVVADPRQVVVRINGMDAGSFWVIDTMVLDKALDRYRPGPVGPDGEKLGGGRGLTHVAEVYGVPMRGDAHDATADALAAGRVAWAIAKRCAMANGEGSGGYGLATERAVLDLYADRKHPHEIARAFAEVGRLTLPDLHACQVKWAAEQARSLARWARDNPDRTDIDPDAVDGSWPLREWKETT